MPRFLLLLLLIVGLGGCRNERSDNPDEAYRQFAAALKRGDVTVAWDSLSPPTRQILEQKSKELAAISKGAIKDDPRLITFASGMKVQPSSEVKLVRSDERSAVLEVTEPSGKRAQKMVKLGNRWYVDLTDSLNRGAAAP